MTTSPGRPSARPPRPQHVLTVESTERLSEHLTRVTLVGEAIATFGSAE